jgi:twitching motility protein PilT
MQTGQSKFGMQTMNQSLHELFMRGVITKDEALGRSSLPDELSAMINRGGIGAGGAR